MVPSAERVGGGDLGLPVAGAGDVDGDGYADVLVGAPEQMGHAGGVLLLHGGPGGIAPAGSDTVIDAPAGGEFGSALARYEGLPREAPRRGARHGCVAPAGPGATRAAGGLFTGCGGR